MADVPDVPSSDSVLHNQANQKRATAAYLRVMATKQRELADEFEAQAARMDRSADNMDRIADEYKTRWGKS